MEEKKLMDKDFHPDGYETSIFTLGEPHEEAANKTSPRFYPEQTSAAFPRYLNS